MSIFKVNQTDFQSITIATNPARYYSSSSSGVTGSINVFPRRSLIEKEISELDDPSTPFKENTLFNSLEQIKNRQSVNFNNLNGFLTGVNQSSVSLKKQTSLGIIRFTPTSYFSTGTLKKLAIKDNLSHYYRTQYPSAHWGYSNYHSLNFFSSSTVPTSSVLLYPNDDDGKMPAGYSSGRYSLSGAFSFDFYINPRYQSLDNEGNFNAGAIFHLSSSYALSLITGSAKDINGFPTSFRLQLQLSHSADIPPSMATVGNYPKNLVFLSDDNSIKLNNWHHVVIRWGTNLINQGTGSFNIDGVDKGVFVIPSGTVAPLSFPDNPTDQVNPDVLCVGNYYEGRNAGNDRLKRFFSDGPSRREGLYRLDATSGINGPDQFQFRHPLQAELHNLSIKRFYVTDSDIEASSSTGLSNTKDVSFYLPPFFTFDSPIRLNEQGYGGIFQSPSIEANGLTTTPFSVELAFGTDCHYINTENFLKDFSSNNNPRQLFLSGSRVEIDSNQGKSANEIFYSQPAVRKRNLTILPCDDGNFYPNYDVLKLNEIKVLYPPSSYIPLDQKPDKISYIDDLGTTSKGFITVNNIVSDYKKGAIPDVNTKDKTLEEISSAEDNEVEVNVGFYPKKPTAAASGLFSTYLQDLSDTTLLPNVEVANKLFEYSLETPLSIVYKTRDSSSNQVVFFDISNLFYGLRILPGSFMIKDSAVTGSGGAVKITIKDDGQGTLYRADSLTSHCKWNSVGTIFYNEGIIAIKSPHLYFFGQEQFEISFKGEQNLHVLRVEALAPTNYLNSSSNPSFKQLPSSLNPNEPDPNFVYITGINFHDDNFNVIMKTQLAQPIMKRHSDKIMFKVKYDF